MAAWQRAIELSLRIGRNSQSTLPSVRAILALCVASQLGVRYPFNDSPSRALRFNTAHGSNFPVSRSPWIGERRTTPGSMSVVGGNSE
jgi:hypothetical protein